MHKPDRWTNHAWERLFERYPGNNLEQHHLDSVIRLIKLHFGEKFGTPDFTDRTTCVVYVMLKIRTWPDKFIVGYEYKKEIVITCLPSKSDKNRKRPPLFLIRHETKGT
jgi:hypothetical protein